MLTPLQLLLALLVPLLLGVLALRALGVSFARDRLAFAAWSWPIGCFLLGASLFVCILLHVPSAAWIAAPLLVAAALACRRSSAPAAVAADPAPRTGRWFAAFALVGAGLPLFYILASQGTPCVFADEANLWALKAKSLFLEWPTGEFRAAQQFSEHADYPLQNPLLQAWVYALKGEVVHFHNRLLVQLCGVSLWLLLCAALRRLAPAWLAALLALPILLDPDFMTVCSTAYSDGMVALGLLLAFDAWLRWRDDALPQHRALAAFGLAFALWSKNEAQMHVAAMAAAAGLGVALRRLPWRRPHPWLLLPAGVIALQFAWNRAFGLVSDYLGAPPSPGVPLPVLFVRQFTHHGPIVLQAAVDALVGCSGMAGMLLPPLLGMVLAPGLCFAADLFVPTLTFAFAFVGLHLIYVGTWLPIDMHLSTSQVRVLCQMVPAAAVWLAAMVAHARRLPAR